MDDPYAVFQGVGLELGAVRDALLALDRSPSPDEVELGGSRVGRNNYPALVADLFCEGGLTQEAAVVSVPSAWSAAEFPLRQLDRPLWRRLFDHAGYTHNMEPASRPSVPMTLYRGATPARRTDWSWTSARSVAERFVYLRAHEGETRVWTAVVNPGHLLAYIGGRSRDEEEYVVDTEGVDITEA